MIVGWIKLKPARGSMSVNQALKRLSIEQSQGPVSSLLD
jgi:hypothetical protein